MNYVLHISTFLFCLCLGNQLHGQTPKQLRNELKTTKQDTIRCRILIQLTELEDDDKRNEECSWEVVRIAEKQLKNTNNSIEEKRIYERYLSGAYMNLGFIHKYRGDIKTSLDFYFKSLKLKEKLNDRSGLGLLHNNIGIIYRQQKDPESALKHFQKSYKIFKETGETKGMAYILNSIGTLHTQLENYEKGIYNHIESMKLSRKINDLSLVAMNYINIGFAYEKQQKLPEAISNYQKSKEISDSINDKLSIAFAHNFMGSAYLGQKRYKEAKEHLEISLQLAQELGFPENIRGAASKLYPVYEAIGDYKRAYQTYELYTKMNDSIMNNEVKTEAVKQQLKYDYEKKTAADSIKSIEERKVVDAQFKKEQTQRYALYIGLSLVITFSFFLYNRFRVINRQKKIIEIKERETHEQNALIFQQKQIIEERHKEITDSINYAERIQRSFLASKELLDRFLPEYFIFFKPKDVVSGDFYWGSELKNGKFALVTADSTGHGVPGAIMSLLNITSLEKAIEYHVQPNEILDYTRTSIINRLKGDGSTEGGKDGMDCSICVFDFEQLTLQVAAANNPVWIVRQGELIEILPDKMPVGRYHNQQTPFTMKEIKLQKNDFVYTMTDGFQDQFGGEKAKKYKTKNLRNLILSLSSLSIEEQFSQVEHSYNTWIGDLEQNDDVCLIGIQV